MKQLHVVIAGMSAVSITATALAVAALGGPETGEARVGNTGQERVSRSASDFHWSGRVGAGDAVEIKGVNGDVSVERASGRDVVVTADVRGPRSNPETVRIEMVEHAGGLTFCAVYSTPEGKRENSCGVGDKGRLSTVSNHVTVNFLVELPADVRFVSRTVNGDVDAFDLGSDIEANTVNGDIAISTTGFAAAETVNGSIEAEMGARDLLNDIVFSTVNGSITLDLHDAVDADVDASWLNGSFESAMPLTLEGRMSRRSARGTLGDGGPHIELKTVNGSIRIH